MGAVLFPATALLVVAMPGRARQGDGAALFESKVRPALAESCFSCHGEKVQMGGVRLDTPAGAKAAAARIPAALTHTGPIKMPPTGKLPDGPRRALTEWARAGAPFPAKPSARVSAETHWSFQPVTRPAVPSVKTAGWAIDPIDRFILARLEKDGLKPAPAADRRTLIRRVTFDLTGLPPTPDEVDAFVADTKPGAYERVVDRLLASPRYGERWGRHWLDVVRYCDSLDARGLGGEGDIAFAWRYRDWVIDALNRDLPYDKFVLEQVAGDLLPGADGDVNVPGTIATGFLAIGNWGNGDADKDKILTDIADDQVDTVGKAVLGLTVGCARCHDHKFDPISTRDYYAMAGIFFSTHILPKLTPKGAGETPLRIALETRAERDARAKLQQAETDLNAFLNTRRAALAAALAPETKTYLEAIRRGDEAGLKPYAVRRWKDALGLNGYPLMATPTRAVGGNPGIDGVRGASDTPSATVNATDAARQILTFTLPPRSVAVHPSPSNGVVAEWVSPIDGTVAVAGRAADADPACGNGIAWRIEKRDDRGSVTLAEGAFGNGGAQDVAGERLKSVAVRRGERVMLAILPNGEYGCDTTVVELTLTAGDGRRWSLTADALKAPGQNPVGDSFGNPAVWRFADMAGVPGAALPEAVRTAWRAGDVAAAAAALAAAPPADSPFAPDADADFPDADRAELLRRRAEIAALRAQAPPAPVFANGAQDGGVPESPHAGFHDVAVHIRGRYDRLGDTVPRGVPTVLAARTGSVTVRQGSGRLELGRWLGDPKNPLPARVMVNRLWQHHFGEGIVRTPSNFGALGERPTHPELLDWLASEFVKNGWSLKKLHRTMVLSATYRQSSEGRAETIQADPDNRLVGRMARHRLEAEELRDSLLAAAGRLETSVGGEPQREFGNPRRSVYLMTVRSDRTGFGPLFDMADSTNSIDRRTVSTVAPQALFLLNAGFVDDQARALASRLRREAPDDRARIERAYRLLYGRPARTGEIELGMRYLKAAGDGAWESYAQVLLCANEFLFVD